MKLNRFIKNSDYTSEKQKMAFTLTLPNGSMTAGAFGGIAERHVDFTVPAGAYFENVLWQTSLTGSRRWSGPTLYYEPDDMMYSLAFSVAQVNSTTYRLTAYLLNYDESAKTLTLSASAKVRLSVSPF